MLTFLVKCQDFPQVYVISTTEARDQTLMEQI